MYISSNNQPAAVWGVKKLHSKLYNNYNVLLKTKKNIYAKINVAIFLNLKVKQFAYNSLFV